MAMKWVKARVFPIGIDLGTHSLKMAQMRLQEGQLELMAAAAVEVPTGLGTDLASRGRFFVQSVRDLLKDHPFKGRQCVMSLPASQTFVEHIRMAKMPAAQRSQALVWELQGKLPFDPSRAVIQHVVAGEILAGEEPKEELIVMAARRELVEGYLDMARKAKLDCSAINLEPCAIVECFSRLFRRLEDQQHATLFVDIGVASTQVVVSHGCSLAFARNLAFGGVQLDAAVAEGLSLSPAEAHALRMRLLTAPDTATGADPEKVYPLLAGPASELAQQIVTCLRYYDSVFPNRPVERALFLGGQAYDKRLCQNLAQRLTLPAQVGDPLAGIRRNVQTSPDSVLDRRNAQPDWAVAVGLSLGSQFVRSASAA